METRGKKRAREVAEVWERKTPAKKSKKEIDEKTRSALKATFNVFDQDGNGHITEDELFNVMNSLSIGVTKNRVKKMMAIADKDKNGTIEFEEFVEVISMDDDINSDDEKTDTGNANITTTEVTPEKISVKTPGKTPGSSMEIDDIRTPKKRRSTKLKIPKTPQKSTRTSSIFVTSPTNRTLETIPETYIDHIKNTFYFIPTVLDNYIKISEDRLTVSGSLDGNWGTVKGDIEFTVGLQYFEVEIDFGKNSSLFCFIGLVDSNEEARDAIVFKNSTYLYINSLRQILGNTEQRMKIGVLVDMDNRFMRFFTKKREIDCRGFTAGIRKASPFFSVACGCTVTIL